MNKQYELISRRNKCLMLSIWACLCLFASSQVGAQVTNLGVSANTTQIQDRGNATINLNWSGLSLSLITSPTSNFNADVVSNSGAFTSVDGSPLRTVNRRIQTTVTLGPTMLSAPFNVRETLRIPASLTVQAREQGSAGISYTRTFSDGMGGTDTATVNFQITSSSSGRLTISRVDLRFDNDQIVRVVAQGEQLSAVADINYNGIGQFVFDWQVALPASTQGEPFFVSLKTHRRYLGAGREAHVLSPDLPTDAVGTYLVRLNIRSPDGIDAPVEIKYAVRKGAEGDAVIQFKPMKLIAPLSNVVLGEGTLFEWAPINGVAAYQLELYENAKQLVRSEGTRSLEKIRDQDEWEVGNSLSSGLLLPGNKHSVRLSPLSRQHLVSGGYYQWRVVGISVKGRIIAKSPLRSILVP